MQFDISDYQTSLGNQKFGSNIQYIKETHSTNDEIWHHEITNNPLIIITAVREMSSFYNDVCTNTLGDCLSISFSPI